MKRLVTLMMCCVLFCSTIAFCQRKAIFIIVDGIPADVIEKLDLPSLAEIRKTGGYARAYQGGEKDAYSQSPTISAVGYNNVLTGVWANKHNVWDNDIADPNYQYWNIFRIAKAAKPELKIGIFSTWLDNRTKLVGEKLPQAGSVQFDYAFDGYELDTVRFPHTKDRTYLSRIDDHVAAAAARTIREQAPDLSWVYLEFTDDMGHLFGDSPQFYGALEKADAQIGMIWKEVKTRQEKFGEEWMIVITTDHGRDAATGKGHGGQSDRERSTWMITNQTDLNNRFRSKPGAVDVLPSLLHFMKIEPPEYVKNELDGVSFLGPICAGNLVAIANGADLELTWSPLGPGTPGEVLISTTNNFGKGGTDTYEKVADINTADGKIRLIGKGAGAQKVLIRTKLHTINAWVRSQ
jgi:hypothetical protein